jgi:hypothetical protein
MIRFEFHGSFNGYRGSHDSQSRTPIEEQTKTANLIPLYVRRTTDGSSIRVRRDCHDLHHDRIEIEIVHREVVHETCYFHDLDHDCATEIWSSWGSPWPSVPRLHSCCWYP